MKSAVIVRHNKDSRLWLGKLGRHVQSRICVAKAKWDVGEDFKKKEREKERKKTLCRCLHDAAARVLALICACGAARPSELSWFFCGRSASKKPPKPESAQRQFFFFCKKKSGERSEGEIRSSPPPSSLSPPFLTQTTCYLLSLNLSNLRLCMFLDACFATGPNLCNNTASTSRCGKKKKRVTLRRQRGQ